MLCLCLNLTYANVIRFPRELNRHGVAFLLPYLLLFLLVGIPIILLEIALGQFLGQGSAHSWRASPIFRGKLIIISCIRFIHTFTFVECFVIFLRFFPSVLSVLFSNSLDFLLFSWLRTTEIECGSLNLINVLCMAVKHICFRTGCVFYLPFFFCQTKQTIFHSNTSNEAKKTEKKKKY